MGLVQREIEAAGFSAISLSMIPELTASAGAPRIAAIEHPFGVPAPPPIARYLARHPWALPRFLNRTPPVSGG